GLDERRGAPCRCNEPCARPMPGPMPAPLRAAARALALLLLAVAGLLLARAFAREPALIVGRACDHAILVDGLLRCGDAAPSSLADLCPGRPAVAPLRSGDAIRRALLCVQPGPARGGPGWRRMSPADLEALALPVQINEADAAELASLPGV